MIQLRVQSGTSSYSISVGNRAWHEVGRFCRREKYSSVFIVTESRIWQAWGKKFLRATGLPSGSAILVPPGERSKSLSGVKALAQQLVKRRADRHSALVALGGGVVGDLAGFVASIYMRGIDTIQAPTTMVAQIDSAIGGKTGVNLPEAKNMLGTLTPPRLVAVNPEVLGSLSPRAYRSGLYEAVKHGIIRDARLFHFIRENLNAILAQDPRIMNRLIAWAAGVKVRVVSLDERESDLRRVLNFGHTLGHALEAAAHYRRFLHGEAVGWGMLLATRIAEGKKMLPAPEARKMEELICSLGPLPTLRGITARRLIGLLGRDKKTVRGVVHWVLSERIGSVRIVTRVGDALVEKAFRDVQRLPV